MKKIALYLVFSILLLCARFGYAQNFKLLKTFGTKSGFDRIQRVSAEANGGCSFLFAYVTNGSKADTLNLGSYQYIKNPAFQSANFLVRLDSGGKVLKVRLLSQGKDLNNMCRDEKGNFYIAGQIGGSGVFDGITMSGTKGNLVFAKYDTDLNRIWLTQTGYSANPHDLFYSQGRLLFTCRASTGATTIGSRTFNFSYTNFVYGEINQSTGNVSWCNNLYKSSSFTDYVQLTGIQYLKGSFFITGISSTDVNLGGTGYLNKGGFIVKTDSVGNYKQAVLLQNKKYSGFSCLTTDGEFLYMSGNDLDSFYLDGKKIYSPNGELTVASYTPSLKLRWYYQPKVIDKSKLTGGPVIAASNEGYIYFGGILKTKIEMGGSLVSPSGSNDVFLFKMDYLGNVLWAANGGTNGEMFGLDAIAGRYVFAGGYFEKKITFGAYTDSSKGETDGWLTKIMDNSITRGNIKKGPYCAGDTIEIPFTKFGEFDTSNYFIAELSDENGNFETGAMELGRIKSNAAGTVLGKLPLLKVATSGKYNIRVRSTFPALQSFYRYDTLNLLIYSRDKANPGPPETICLGDTLKLSTYGGTKWGWSPKYNIDDVSKRQPLVWPTRDTIYQIIISDSFGCGLPDTAFKKVLVRKLPKTILKFTDTLLCDNTPFKIAAHFTGGDSTYYWQWLATPPGNQWLSLGKGKGKLADTILYRPSTTTTTPEKAGIILNDGCTSKSDTAFVTIGRRKKVNITNMLRDTTLCPGQKVKYKAFVSGGVTKYLRYLWINLNNNSVLSTSDSFVYVSTSSVKIRLIVNDGCTSMGDTSDLNISLKPILRAITNLRDTSVCYGQLLNLIASGKGGDSATYNFSWVLGGKLISSSANLVFKTEEHFSNKDENKTLQLVLKDNCSLPYDTVKKIIKIKTSPRVNFTNNVACSRTATKFMFTGSKPNAPVLTVFYWDFNKEITSNLENPSHKFAKVGLATSTLTLISNNGCRDTLSKKIEIKPQAKAIFITSDVCESDSAVFINQSEDATGFTWKFGDGNKSQIKTPKHKYQITSTTTYNVTLVAIAEGCSDSISQAITINKNPTCDFSFTKIGSKINLTASKTGFVSYKWVFGTTDSITNTITTYTYNQLEPDQKKVCLIATDLVGCSSKTCKDLTASISSASNQGFKLYPNPNNGQDRKSVV